MRWIATAFDPPLALLAPLQLLHALSFGATHLGTMMFLSQNAPRGRPRRRARRHRDRQQRHDGGASALAGVLYGVGGSFAYVAMALFAAAGGAFALAARKL